MKPEIGKWYHIEYNSKRYPERVYNGPAKCLIYSEVDESWGFRLPNEYEFPEIKSAFGLSLFREQDIIGECEPQPSYGELKELYEKYKTLHESKDLLYGKFILYGCCKKMRLRTPYERNAGVWWEDIKAPIAAFSTEEAAEKYANSAKVKDNNNYIFPEETFYIHFSSYKIEQYEPPEPLFLPIDPEIIK